MCNACGLELFMLNPPGAVIRSEHSESLLTTVALKKNTKKSPSGTSPHVESC